MRQLRHVAAVLGVLACSDVTSTGNGVIAIQVIVPADAAVEPGDTLILVAQALEHQYPAHPLRMTQPHALLLLQGRGAAVKCQVRMPPFPT